MNVQEARQLQAFLADLVFLQDPEGQDKEGKSEINQLI